MNWKLIKANWFYAVMAVLVVVGIFKNKIPIRSWLGGSPEPKKEIYTDQGTNQMGVVPKPDTAPPPPLGVLDEKVVQFVARFSTVAVGERKKFGIPASVILGIAILNSQAGQGETVTQASNYFALGCAEDWEGSSIQITNQCTRKYATPWESFRDFSIYLSVRDWYGDLKKTAGKDTKLWAKGLENKGIVKVSDSANRLSALIAQYDLTRFDSGN